MFVVVVCLSPLEVTECGVVSVVLFSCVVCVLECQWLYNVYGYAFFIKLWRGIRTLVHSLVS